MTTISHITLELARETEHPHGSNQLVYHLYLPPLPDGSIDAARWRKTRALCRVRKIQLGKEEERGQIMHGPGGRWISTILTQPPAAMRPVSTFVTRRSSWANTYPSVKATARCIPSRSFP